MKAALFVEAGRIVLDEKRIPEAGSNDALIRIITTTICGTDVHILKGGGEYPVAKGLNVGHEPDGIIEKLGRNVQGYREGERVIAGRQRHNRHDRFCRRWHDHLPEFSKRRIIFGKPDFLSVI